MTEVYRFSVSRKVVWTALACNLFLSLYLYLATQFKPSNYAHNHQEFEAIFSLPPTIFAASIISYLIGELVKAIIISQLKIKLKGRMFALRAIASTTIGSAIESMIFCMVAFANILALTKSVAE